MALFEIELRCTILLVVRRTLTFAVFMLETQPVCVGVDAWGVEGGDV